LVWTSKLLRRFTLFIHHQLSKIPQTEYIYFTWNRLDPKTHHLRKAVTYFNGFTSWIASQILQQPKCKNRAKIISYFIKLAWKCQKFNNFEAMSMICCALTNSSIHRLTQTWKRVQKDNSWNKLQEIMCVESSWKNYRQKLMNATPPVIPCLAIFLQDLQFIQEGNYTYLPVEGDRLDVLNWSKLGMIGQTVSEMNGIMIATKYPFQKVEIIFNFFCLYHVQYDRKGTLPIIVRG